MLKFLKEIEVCFFVCSSLVTAKQYFYFSTNTKSTMIWILNLLILVVFVVSLPIVVVIQSAYHYYWDYALSFMRHDVSTDIYDFIIVGAGSAGAVVANQLSKNNKVLLLDAGGDPLYPNSIPCLAPNMLHRPQGDFSYKTVPQKNSHFGQSIPNVSVWPRGMSLGGSSNLNYMFYIRGNALDYDNWANLTKDPSWSYENVLPIFKKVLDYQGEFKTNEKQYGQSAYGSLHVENTDFKPMYENFIDAVKELGYDNIDLNGPQRTGFGQLERSHKNGQRASTFTSFLKPILERKNLIVSRYSYVTKIKIDKNGQAVGVWYIQHGIKKFVRASKEIILSAGAVESPKILLLSGIGPKEHLHSVGIKQIVELPVGKNLQDHIGVFVAPFIVNDTVSLIPERDLGWHSFWDYYVNGKGPMTNPTVVVGSGFSSSSFVQRNKIDWPDLQYYFMSFGMYQNIEDELSQVFGLKKEILGDMFAEWKGKDAFSFATTLVRPKSIGELKLKDKDPMSYPLIDPRYLEDPQDIKVLMEGIKITFKIAEETKAFQKLGTYSVHNPISPCAHFIFRSDEYWTCYIKHLAVTIYHPSSTCTMGYGVDDPKAVTDSNLRVLKVRGLRVADTSVMPVIINGNTNAPTIMIGQKASDLIREHWSAQYLVCSALERLCTSRENKCYYSRLS